MKIREYLNREGLVIKHFTEAIGISWHYGWMISKGLKNPSVALAHQIEQWSNGNVKVHEIRKCTNTCPIGCACSKGGK